MIDNTLDSSSVFDQAVDGDLRLAATVAAERLKLAHVQPAPSGGPAAPKQMQDKRDDGDDQKKMDQAARDVKSQPRHRPDTEQHEKENQKQKVAKHASLLANCQHAKAHSRSRVAKPIPPINPS
jgi:hypothetical protein